MVNKAYKKGYAFELRVKKYFESIGYDVYRSAGSHSVADLIAFKIAEIPLLIQCKAGGKISNKESNELHRVAVRNGTISIFVGKNRKGRLVIEKIKEMI